jgi:hypothetical protein
MAESVAGAEVNQIPTIWQTRRASPLKLVLNLNVSRRYQHVIIGKIIEITVAILNDRLKRNTM